MCLILFAWKTHQNFPLILMANRDEFYARPTQQAHQWEDAPFLYAGKDLEGNGTWLGVTQSGKWAALTNYRAPSEMRKEAPSRGNLVLNYLKGTITPTAYLQQLKKENLPYNGYNLLLGTTSSIHYYSNKEKEIKEVNAGIHGLSNHLLDTSWPKVERGKEKLSSIKKDNNIEADTLIHFMEDTEQAPDDKLPQTGVGQAWERLLSSMFIASENYGTRCTSILLMDKEDRFSFIEKTHNVGKKVIAEPSIVNFTVG